MYQNENVRRCRVQSDLVVRDVDIAYDIICLFHRVHNALGTLALVVRFTRDGTTFNVLELETISRPVVAETRWTRE